MKKATFFTLAAAAVLLACSPSSKAAIAEPALVTPGDTFSFDIAGFNSTGTTGFLLTPALTATFGTTQTFTGVGVNGQNITITSSETVGATTTTDTFTISTPTSFLTTAAVNGTTITQLQFDLGNANSGSNVVNLTGVPITSSTATGSVVFSGGTLALTPTTTVTPGGLSYAAVEGVNAGTSAISTFAVRQFTYSITYNTLPVPEPSTYAAMAVGALALGTVMVRRNRRQALV